MTVEGFAEGSVAIAWNGVDSRRRRMVFEPRGEAGHIRYSQRYNGAEWVTSGQEIVADVDLDAPAAVMRGGSTTLG